MPAQAGERLVVDAFARYRITDPLKFYQTVGPDGANTQLAILLNSALRRVLGAATLADAVRNKREELMAQMRDQLDRDAQPFGIHIVDVRIRRVDLPEQNSQAVYPAHANRAAARSRRVPRPGQPEEPGDPRQGRSRRDRAHGRRQLSSPSRSAARATPSATSIFADAYGQDPDFFAFYRSMQAYETSMQHGDTHLVLRPDTDFFRFFGDPSGKTMPADGEAPAVASGARLPASDPSSATK